MPTKKQIPIKKFYSLSRQVYDNLPIKVALDELQEDYTKTFSSIIKPITINLIMVDKIFDALKILDFDWLNKHSKDGEIKYFYTDGNLIGNINDFYTINETQLINLSINDILDEWDKLILAAFQNTGSFTNNRYKNKTMFIYIKSCDTQDYLNDESKFEQKSFGDNLCKVFANFFYKPEDEEFKQESLTEQTKIAKFNFYHNK